MQRQVVTADVHATPDRACADPLVNAGIPRDSTACLQRSQGNGEPGAAFVALATQSPLQPFDAACADRGRLAAAIDGLQRSTPHLSAAGGMWPWQRRMLVVALLLLVAGAASAPQRTLAILVPVLAVPFLGIVVVRLLALRHALAGGPPDHPAAPACGDPADLPTYAVLVALFRETAVLPRLIAALSDLDYPADRLDIVLILEAIDVPTRAALERTTLPAHFRIVVVPEALPRTKPKALNYALATVTADLIVIYDAEDRPEPDQLRRAAQRFRTGPADLGCLQARLDLDNADESIWSRQFALEYAALFDAILPTLERLRLPMPLGGTSNHFPRAVLAAAGGWDAYNVTEDADLGVRLARLGFTIATLPSRTFEEAPIEAGQWFGQRTRWLKGWMQTYIVHTREPLRLARELGPFGALGFHAYLGGLVLSALVHPWVYVLWAMAAATDRWPSAGADPLAVGLWWLAAANLVLGYLGAILLGAIAGRRRGQRIWPDAALMPVYWLAISIAAYRALWELRRAPFFWEKTAHGVSRLARPPQE